MWGLLTDCTVPACAVPPPHPGLLSLIGRIIGVSITPVPMAELPGGEDPPSAVQARRQRCIYLYLRETNEQFVAHGLH